MREWLGAALLVLGGCGGLRMNVVDAVHRPPSNVAVFFSVDGKDGDPVSGLEASNFEIYEDGERVAISESKQTILEPKLAAAHYTLLLLDMSASSSEPNQVPLVVDAARDFLSELSSPQRVAVYAFDGSPSLHRLQSFSSAPKSERTLKRLERFRTKNPSTNLHGAVRDALRVLDEGLDRAKEPLRFGTLVVFTDGNHRAARISAEQLDQAIAATKLDIFAIGVGSEIEEATLSRVGVNGYVLVPDKGGLRAGLRTIGQRIARFTQRYYLLSYCSPAPEGTHQVTIRGVDPQSGATGKLRYAFEARSSRPHCDPNRRPRFNKAIEKYGTVRRGDAPRGLRLKVALDTTALAPVVAPEPDDAAVRDTTALDPAADPELGDVSQQPPPLNIEALENELPPGLKPGTGDDEDEDEDSDED